MMVEYVNDTTYQALKFFTRAQQDIYNSTLDTLRASAAATHFLLTL